MMHGRYEGTYRDPANSPSRRMLTSRGALLDIEIGRPSGIPPGIAQPLRGLGAIDTGATSTAVDRRVFSALGLASRSFIRVSTPMGVQTLDTYQVRIWLPQVDLELDLRGVAAIDLSGASVTVDGVSQNIIALIGRDILERCVFTYNGPAASFSLSVPEEIS